MRDKIKDAISKTKEYYVPSKKYDSEELPPEKEVKKLRKENEKLQKEFFEQVRDKFSTRRSVRSYSQRPVDDKTIFDCLDAALNSPAAGNIQDFRVILVKDDEAKKKIAQLALDQCWIADAPVVAVVVRDDKQMNMVYPQFGERYSLQNVSAFITAFIYMIHFAGYSTCWVEACEEGVLKEYLEIPSTKEIDAIIPIGYPMEIPKVEKVTLHDICYFEKHGKKKR